VGGFVDDAGGAHGFLLRKNGSFKTIDVPDAFRTELHGINNAGKIVGIYTDSAGNAHGFLAVP
jgi:hypothetical protein